MTNSLQAAPGDKELIAAEFERFLKATAPPGFSIAEAFIVSALRLLNHERALVEAPDDLRTLHVERLQELVRAFGYTTRNQSWDIAEAVVKYMQELK